MRTFVVSALVGAAFASTTVFTPPTCSYCTEDAAIVWIAGPNYTQGDYHEIAQEFQAQASLQGINAWIGIPSLQYSKVETGLIDSYVQDAVSALGDKGYHGDNWFLAAHSLGGVMAQNYTGGAAKFTGQVLMGSALTRDKVSIQKNGHSQFSTYNYPTLTIGGTKDGFNRISRVSEAYWHQVKNINTSQNNRFPIVELEGVSHAQFASESNIPSEVAKGDLKPDVSFDKAHSMIGSSIASWMSNLLHGRATTTDKATVNLLAPMVYAME